jgi:hypothetical protein
MPRPDAEVDVPEPYPTESHRRVAGDDSSGEGRSTLDVLRSIGDDLSTLIRKQAELARQETEQSLESSLAAVAAVAVASVFGIGAIVMLGFAAVAGLDDHLGEGLAALAVAGVAVVLAGAAFAFARSRLRRTRLVPEQTTRTVKEDVEWAKTRLKP